MYTWTNDFNEENASKTKKWLDDFNDALKEASELEFKERGVLIIDYVLLRVEKMYPKKFSAITETALKRQGLPSFGMFGYLSKP